MDMKRSEEQRITSLDIYLAAFLSLHQVAPTLTVSNGRVIFVFPSTERTNQLITAYNMNTNVPVADFVVAVKTLRGKMLSMRENAR